MNLEQLTNLSDEELNRMAAERILSWTLMPEAALQQAYWMDDDLNRTVAAEDYCPTADRDQSGELLAAVAARGAKISVEFGELSRVWVKAGDCSWMHVAGNGARSETIAALMAHFAMEETGK